MTARQTARKARSKTLEADAKAREVSLRHRHTPVIEAIDTFAKVGDQPPLRMLSAGLVVAGLLRRDPRMAGAGARMLLSLELATLAKDFVKQRVDRTRPSAAEGESGIAPTKGRSTDHDETSFPSGHSAGSMAVASAFAAAYPQHSGKALAAAGAVAAAQVPRCAHYPSDVGAGLAIGKAADVIVGGAWRLAGSALAWALARRAGLRSSP